MRSLEFITNELKNEMKMHVTDSQQFNTWINILKPLNLHEGTLYLEIPKKDTLFIFDGIWLPKLQEALYAIEEKIGARLDVKVVAKDGDDYDKVLTLGKEYDGDGQMRIDKVKSYPRPQLEEANVFENFVQGKSNQYALSISQAVADTISRREQSKVYNPLFIYGASGLGKTHLIQAIAHQVLEARDDVYVMYLSSEKFTNEMIAALRTNKNQEFRSRYRSVDILLIDDIQFIANKEATQEEFFHTFNDLYNAGKQIVITSDKPPREIKHLEDRLVSRFNYGIIADISRPDYETRVAILQKKLEDLGAIIDNSILSYIAHEIDTNIRDLEGALSTAIAYAKSDGRIEVSMEDAIKGVGTRVKNTKKKLSIGDIQQAVANKYNIKLSDLKGKSRKKEIVNPRQIAMFIARELLDDSLVTIANAFDRDHTTVIHGIDKISLMMEEDSDIKNEIESLIKEIKE
ncbi:chromosomal replication initiator protein DnaA [Anaerococcus sp. NML200574]|uniref:chromosomal replication initiator protein DnaA n=1 Tax=unclassified Anaerococcus TaxID=2614126 RepID=UPI000D0AC576|nr:MULTISPECIES: chromosomal replication initiator protein DnaA [unclassified Anaerococcus]MCW6678491.1 chromosomal replication initiator protein DnaA [Anaerococcus sp. NML200574]MCW6702022.1 chromosomal replication initiator protein DnaA [Anaerococcus sp. NML200537]